MTRWRPALFSLFKRKTEQAVKRSKDTWFGKITSIFDRPTIDKQSWEELEELLIAADAGVDTAAKLIQRVKDRVGKEKIGDARQVRAALMQEMALMLKIDGKEPVAAASPRVILVVGVNGSGKTTTIAKLGYNYVKDSHAPARSGLDRLLSGQPGQKVSGLFAQRRSGRVGSLVVLPGNFRQSNGCTRSRGEDGDGGGPPVEGGNLCCVTAPMAGDAVVYLHADR